MTGGTGTCPVIHTDVISNSHITDGGHLNSTVYLYRALVLEETIIQMDRPKNYI